MAPTGKTHTRNQLPSHRRQAGRTQTSLLPRARAGRAVGPKWLYEGVERGSWRPGPESSPTHFSVPDRSAVHPGHPAQSATLGRTTLHPHPSFFSPPFTFASGHGVVPPPSAVCTRAKLVPGINPQQTGLDHCSPHGGNAAVCRQLGACLHPGWACLWGQHIPALFLPTLFPSPSLPHASVQASGTSQRGTGRGTRLARWLGTYQHLPAAPLPFSSRPHPLKGLMHLPLSCCEMQRLKNSSTGSPRRRGGRRGRCLQEQTAQRMAAEASLASQ